MKAGEGAGGFKGHGGMKKHSGASFSIEEEQVEEYEQACEKKLVQRSAFQNARYSGEFKLHSAGQPVEQEGGLDCQPERVDDGVKSQLFRQEMNVGFLRRDANGLCFNQRHLIENSEIMKFDLNKDYKQEYMRVYLANMMIMDRIQRCRQENEEIQSNILNLKTKVNEQEETESDDESDSDQGSASKRRKKRRKKEEIERGFTCSANSCGKSYGSENSLNQHLKLKHPEIWEFIKDNK